MTAPGGTPRPGNRTLATATAALSVALAAALASGVLHRSSSTPNPASAFGCPDSLPGALVIRFASADTSGVARDTVTAPVVVCGARTLAYNLQAHPEAGTGILAILSPPDTAAFVAESVPPLVQGTDARHWYLPSSSPYLASTGLYQLAVQAVDASGVALDSAARVNFAVPILETADSGATWILRSTLFYRPARGTRPRTMLNSWRNVCHPGSVILYCVGPDTSEIALNAWYGGWLQNIIPQSQTVLNVTVIRSAPGMTALPSLVAP